MMSTINELVAGESFEVPREAWDAGKGLRCHLAILREDDGTFSVLVLNLPGAGSSGDSEEAAVANAREAIAGVIESYIDDGEAIPWKTDYSIPRAAKLKWILVNV